MEFKFWKERWDAGRIGFHQAAVNRHLLRFGDALADTRATGILVPLCGKSHDLTWLSERFDRVVGVEFVEEAVRDYFVERQLASERELVDGLIRYRAAGVDLFAADFHSVTLAHTGPLNRVFDRASMIALPPETRPRYAAHLSSMMPPGGRILLVTLVYPQHRREGPPFSVPESEVRALYGAACTLEKLADEEPPDVPADLAAAGVRTHVWLITKR